MKLKLATMLMLTFLVGAGFSQGNIFISPYTGYTMTAFEDQDDAAGTLPLGVQLGYMVTPSLEVGAEVSTALGGFTFVYEEPDYKTESTVNYMVFGVYGKYFLTQEGMKPFVKAGAGMFTGDIDVELTLMGEKVKDTSKYDSAIGFTVGGGVQINEKYFVGFDYNLVSRKPSDVDGAESDGWNTWAVKAGYRFGL